MKDAYTSRVRELAKSAGWVAAEPAASAWSPGAFHSWSGRQAEQPIEETEKQQALTQPTHMHFRFEVYPAALTSAGR